jgi:hypothetical protein
VSIVLESEERIDGWVAPAAVYIALRSHEEKCLVGSLMEMAEGEHDPRTLRRFHVTEQCRSWMNVGDSRIRAAPIWGFPVPKPTHELTQPLRGQITLSARTLRGAAGSGNGSVT